MQEELLEKHELLKQRVQRIVIPDEELLNLQKEIQDALPKKAILKVLEKKVNRAEVVAICWKDLNDQLETLKQRFESLPQSGKGEKTVRAWISCHLTFKWLVRSIGDHKSTLQKLDREITKLESRSRKKIKFL